MSRSPERTTAPPISAGSTVQCRRTSRRSRCAQGRRESLLLALVERGRGHDFDVGHVLGLGLRAPRSARRSPAGSRGDRSRTAAPEMPFRARRARRRRCRSTRPDRSSAGDARAAARASGTPRSPRRRARSRASPTTRPRGRSRAHARTPPWHRVSLRWLSRPSVASPAHGCRGPQALAPSISRASFLDQVGVRLRIDLALEQPGGPGDRERARRPCGARRGRGPARAALPAARRRRAAGPRRWRCCALRRRSRSSDDSPGRRS